MYKRVCLSANCAIVLLSVVPFTDVSATASDFSSTDSTGATEPLAVSLRQPRTAKHLSELFDQYGTFSTTAFPELLTTDSKTKAVLIRVNCGPLHVQAGVGKDISGYLTEEKSSRRPKTGAFCMSKGRDLSLVQFAQQIWQATSTVKEHGRMHPLERH